MKKITLILFLISILFLLKAKQNNLPVVDNFKIDKYLGKWYEIARYPHFFEKGLDRVTAEYNLMENGKIKVINKGFSQKKSKWKEASGKAWFADKTDVGHLKVSFFWPFSSDYKIVWLNQDYSIAIVVGKDFDYFWLLARSPEMEENVYKEFIDIAVQWGFERSKMIKVNH